MSAGVVTRRYLLRSGAAALASALAGACGKKVPASCLDAPGLAPEDAKIRSDLGYVDASPALEKRCASCRQYAGPSEEGACGTCHVVKGPIHPNGTCKVFGARG